MRVPLLQTSPSPPHLTPRPLNETTTRNRLVMLRLLRSITAVQVDVLSAQLSRDVAEEERLRGLVPQLTV